MPTDWDRVSFIMAGQKRKRIMTRLQRSPCTPKQLSSELGILMPNVSITLKELNENGLVKNLTPRKRKGKMFTLTANGQRVMSTIDDLKKPKRRRKT